MSDQPVCKIYKSGHKEWRLNGQLHREDGPAIERTSGDKFWYLNGELHREDGPAIENINGNRYWHLHGEEILCSSQQKFERLIKLKAFW